MFGLFKKKTRREALLERYNKLMQESHKLSAVNRVAADQKYAEAEKLMQEVDQLEEDSRF